MKRIDIDFLPLGPGITDIHVNDYDPKDSRRYLSATFIEQPTELKLLACWTRRGLTRISHYPFIQVSLTTERWNHPARMAGNRENVLTADIG